MTKTYYLIRHKATGEIMPLMKRNRGYSHWNPPNYPWSVTNIPRLIESEKSARKSIAYWACYPNMYYKYGFDDIERTETHNDNRKKEDLEIIEVTLSYG